MKERSQRTGELFGEVLLKQGNSKIVALAYGETYALVKNVLKVVKPIIFLIALIN